MKHTVKEHVSRVWRPLWIDLNQPHTVACLWHRHRLSHPTQLLDPRSWRLSARDRFPVCEARTR